MNRTQTIYTRIGDEWKWSIQSGFTSLASGREPTQEKARAASRKAKAKLGGGK